MFLWRYIDFLRTGRPQHLILNVTNNCNLRCDHCFVDFSADRELQLFHWQRLARAVGKIFWLDISGGEPFLREDLVDIVSSFDAEMVQIPTNSTLPARVVKGIAALRERTTGQLLVSLSVDGHRELHDKIRGQPGNYDQVWETFARLRQIQGVKIKINTVVTQHNFPQLLSLMREVRARNPDFHSIILMRGDPLKQDLGLPPLEQLARLGPQIFDILETYNYGEGGVLAAIAKNYHRYLWNLTLATLREGRQVIPCLAGRSHLVLMANGDVKSCELRGVVGNIMDESWDELLSGNALKRQRKSIQNRECHCTHNCVMTDNILFRPRSIPHLLRERLKQRAGVLR